MDVADWLKGLGLAQYDPTAFRENHIIEALAQADRGRSRGSRGRNSRSSQGYRGPVPRNRVVAVGAKRALRARGVRASRRATAADGDVLRSGRVDGVIGAFHRCCATVIERAGGSGAKYMGAGELAHFGHPRADEHHAERAVPAGLALVQAAAGLTPRRGTRKRLLPAAKRRAKSGYYEKTMARSGGRCRPSALST